MLVGFEIIQLLEMIDRIEMMSTFSKERLRLLIILVCFIQQSRGEQLTNDTLEPLVPSRLENGRFVNSFNPQYKLPSFGHVLYWKITTSDNARVPTNKNELDRLLPVIQHEKLEDFYLSKPGLRFIWIGHASCLIQMNNFRFLLDPVFR